MKKRIINIIYNIDKTYICNVYIIIIHFILKRTCLFLICILYIITLRKLHYFIMSRSRHKSLTFKREERLTRVRLYLIFGDFVHFRENFIFPYRKIKKEIKGARPLYRKKFHPCYGDTIIIKLNILGTLLIKKPICPARFIKNPSGGIKKLSRGVMARNIFQDDFAFFVLRLRVPL